MERVGTLTEADDKEEQYDAIGAAARTSILRLLDGHLSFDGASVLDFGCGAGRTLRHFLAEAATAEIVGCDIDGPSVEWVTEHLCPPLARAVRSDPEPPLPFDDGSFDLVYAVSVFTHLSSSWAAWLLELRRILVPGGLLVATFIGEGAAEAITGEPYQAETVGMGVWNEGQSWKLGGPMVVHSPWWIEERWGRAFELLAVEPAGFTGTAGHGHGVVLGRNDGRPVELGDLATPRDLTAAEAFALHHEAARRTRDVGEIRRRYDHVEHELAVARTEVDRLTVEREDAERRASAAAARVVDVEASHSWKVTAPLRAVGDRLRATRWAATASGASADGGVFVRAETPPAPMRSPFGGLWYDRADASELLAAALAGGRVSQSDAAALASLRDDGFAIVRGAVDPELAALVAAEVEGLVRQEDARILATVQDHEGAQPRPAEAWMLDRPSLKVLDAYFQLESCRRILLGPDVTRLVRLAFDGDDPLLFQSLNFVRGSEQWLHQDTAYVKVDRPMELIACWIALEDVTEGSGELCYVPGSHRLPEHLFGGERKCWVPECDGQDEHARWAEALPGRVHDAGLTVARFAPKRGDILFWHADLVHGGSPIEEASSTRRSLVAHYCPASTAPSYEVAHPLTRHRERGGWYASDHDRR